MFNCVIRASFYQARRLDALNALASNAIVLTYRGVSYTK
jgi:hypothetical protein